MTTKAENELMEAIFGRGSAKKIKEADAMKIKVRGGTPDNHHRSLCQTCSNALIIRGAAASERRVLCSELKNGYGQEEVPYDIIVECSAFNDKAKLPLYEMKKIAFILKTDPRGKPIGFVPNREFRAEEKGVSGESVEITPGQY